MKKAKELKKFKRQMKKKPTIYEKMLAYILKKERIIFKQQMILGFYIVDFCLPNKMLIVEVDGEYHNNQKNYDILRDNFIRKCGFKIIRIKNKEIKTNKNYSLALINSFLKFPEYSLNTFRSALARANAFKGKAFI